MQIDEDEHELQLFGQTTEQAESTQFVCWNEGLKIFIMKMQVFFVQEVFI